jgi:hypothetical protein
VVDPENRLVARGLEAEWEQSLRQLEAARAELTRREHQWPRARPLLRVIDDRGHRTINPFHGTLCDDCYGQARVLGTPIHGWVLNRIKKVDFATTQKASKGR